VLLPVLRLPDSALKTVAVEVDPNDPAVRALADDLVATMRASPACVGLAATQVGVAARVFCVDVTGHRKAVSCAGLVVLVNPELVESSDLVRAREGCLSVPDLTGDVTRAGWVVVRGLSPAGDEVVVTSDAIEARALQHELDHLDGILFLDRVSSPHRELFARKRYAAAPDNTTG
jgi:peptide deformylase